MTHDSFFFFFFYLQKVPTKANDLLKVPKSAEKVSKRQDFTVLVLLSAQAEKVGVFRIRDFFFLNNGFTLL